MPISQNLWVQPGLDDLSTTYVSNLYPIVNDDSVDIVHALLAASLYTWLPGEIDVTHAMTGGTLNQPLLTYSNALPENIDVVHAFTAGILTQVLLTYPNWPVENVDTAHSFVGGVLTPVLFAYSNWPIENIDVTHSFTGGTLV